MALLKTIFSSFVSGAFLCLAIGCSPAETTDTNPVVVPDDAKPFLESVATNVIAPTYSDFADEAGKLNEAFTALAATPTDTDVLSAARDAWKNAMVSWQRIEVLQIGPAASALKASGGQNIRDEIYSWPTVKPCRIDQEIVENAFDDTEYFTKNLINSYGLDGLEYILFNETYDNQCSTANSLNANGSWAALEESEIANRRSLFGKVLAGQILKHAQELKAFWMPPDGEYYVHFTEPGTDSSPYENYGQVLNEFYAALFYVDLVVKDDKLGIPAGLMAPCDDGTPCLSRLESQWANHSKEAIIANLESFQRAFNAINAEGNDGTGFDDLLAQKGEQALAETIKDGVAGAIEELQSLNTSLKSALESELATVQKAYASLKTATDKLKNEFAEVLELEVPQEGAGDND